MPFCPQCGKEAGESDNFCSACGTKLVSTPIPRTTDRRIEKGETKVSMQTGHRPETRFKLPEEVSLRFRKSFCELKWWEEIKDQQRQKWGIEPTEQIIFAHKTHALRDPVCYKGKGGIPEAIADWIIGTDRRLVFPLQPRPTDHLKPSAISTLGINLKKEVLSLNYPEVDCNLGSEDDLFVHHSTHGVWRIWKFSPGEPAKAERERKTLYDFLKEAHNIACEQGVAVTVASFDRRRKAQEIIIAVKEGRLLPLEFTERVKLFQAGIKICPACASSDVDRRMGEKDTAITGAMVAGAILSGGLLLLPAAAWVFIGKEEFCYTCKQCGFTWQPWNNSIAEGKQAPW